MTELHELNDSQLKSVAIDLGVAFSIGTDRRTMINILNDIAEDPYGKIELQNSIERVCNFDSCRDPIDNTVQSVHPIDHDNGSSVNGLPVFRTHSMMHS